MIAQFSLVYDDAGLEVVAGHGPAASFAQATLDRGVVVDGVIKRPQDFVASLKRMLREATPRRITARHVVVGIPETRVFTTLVQLPAVQHHDLKGALTWQLPELLPVPPDELVVDFQPISARRRDERQLLVMAAPLVVVEPLVQVLETAGFTVDRCVPRSLGIASLFADPAHTPLMLIDQEGSDSLSLIIAKNGTARFSTTVPLDRHQGRVSTAIERAIEFYEARDGQHRTVARILVLPYPTADELVAELDAELKLPVQLADTPWTRRHAPRRLRAFLGSLGLLSLPGVRVNLLPPAVLEQRRSAARAHWLTTAWGAELVVAASVVVGFALLLSQQVTQGATTRAALSAIEQPNASLIHDGQALETLSQLHRDKQGLQSTRYQEYRVFPTALTDGVRLIVVEHDAVKQETRVIGERANRTALATYLTTLSQTYPNLSLAPGDWAAIETAPFHLTVKRP